MRLNKTLGALELQKLTEVFKRYPQVQAVYVFGSQAAGRAGPGSDLDLAIIAADPSLNEKKLDILAELARLGYCNVDLVFLDEDDLVFAYEAIRQNRLIYALPALIGEAPIPGSSASTWISNPTCGSSVKRIRGGLSVLRPEVIRRRLQKLDEYLAILDGLRGYSLEEFLANPERYGSAERFLQLAIEAVLDMGSHVIAELELGTVEAYSDIPKILADKGYISSELAERWIRMIGFRNILVHEYLEIDRKVVYAVLQHQLEDLRDLRKVFAQFL